MAEVPTKIMQEKKNGSIFRRFWVKKSRHSDKISHEKLYLYRSTRLRLFKSEVHRDDKMKRKHID